MKNVLILGGEGYIGSRLQQVLREHFTVDVVDTCWYHGCLNPSVIQQDYSELSSEFLNSYDAIVILAGHSSVKSCEGDIKHSWLNNVTNFSKLLEKIERSNTLVIYASSASIYGNSKPGELHEECRVDFLPVNNYDITKYSLDLFALDKIIRGRNIIGLRFGTVNGWSPNLRTDLMINSMFKSAMTNSVIEISNKHINRAILGIEDLCRAIKVCIDSPVSGIYNLSSFNSSVEKIANTVASFLRVPIVDKGNTEGVYDFNLDNSYFCKTFNFEFTEFTGTILIDLKQNYTKSYFGRRDKPIIYNKEKIL
jgi:nucleoside-diphosphate-sugar epimerase